MASELLEQGSAAAREAERRADGRAGWRYAPAALLAVAVQAPMLVAFAGEVWRLPFRRFTPFLLVGAGVLAVARLRRSGRAFGTGGWVPWVVAAGVTSVAVVFRSPEGAAVAFLMTLLAVADGFGRRFAVRVVLPAWLCVWLALPLPFGLERRAVVGEDAVAMRLASTALDLGGVRHRVVGTTVEVPGRSFSAGREGRPVVFAILAAVGFFAAAARRGPVWSGVLLASTVLWVVVARAVLIAAPVFLWSREGRTIETAVWGTWAVTGATLALVWSTDRGCAWLVPGGERAAWRAIGRVLRGEPVDVELGDESPVGAPVAGLGRRRDGIIAFAGFAIAGALWFAPAVGTHGDPDPGSDGVGAELKERFR